MIKGLTTVRLCIASVYDLIIVLMQMLTIAIYVMTSRYEGQD